MVSTSRFALGDVQSGSHTLVSGDVLQTLPRLGEETLKAVQRLPGVAGNGVSGLSPVRGGEAGETLILLDGLELYEPFHMKNFLSPVSLLDSRFINGLDFYSGGYGAAYGDRMSAVIDAHSLDAPVDHHVELGLSLFHANALAAGALDDGRGDWLVSLRQSNLGRVFNLLESDYGDPEYSDGFARIGYALTEDTHIAFNVLASLDEISIPWERTGESAFARYRNTYVWTTIDHTWSDSLTSRLIASYTDVDNDRQGEVNDPGYRTGNVQDRRSFQVAGVTAAFSWVPKWGVHQWGAEVRQLQAEYDYASRVAYEPNALFPGIGGSAQTRNLAVSPDGWAYAAFWSSRLNIADAWVMEAGVRLEDQEYTGPEHAVQATPRLSLLYTALPSTRLRASWGQYSQSQRINELQIEDGIVTFLPAQHASHLVLGFDHDWSPTMTSRLEAYRKDYSTLKPRFENLFDPLVLLPELQADRVRIAPSSARMQGIEMSLSWRPRGAWSGWFSYVWSETEDVVSGVKTPRSWDQTHAVSTGIRWTRGRWDVTLADTWHSGWPMTAVAVQTAATPGGNVSTAVIGPRNGERLGSFQSLDLRASRRFALPRGELEAFLEITNLTNHDNPCCIDYQVVTEPDGATRLDVQTSNWLGVVPSIGVLWKY